MFSKVEGFEGKVNILREGAYDTILVEVYIKGNYLKVNEFGKHNRLLRSYIANLSTGTTYLISYNQKMYSVLKTVENSPLQHNIQIVKSENSVEIEGIRCFQWRVRNSDGQTETTYWVALSTYDFMIKLHKALANTGSAIEEMVNIPLVDGVMPFMVVDRTRFRKIRSCIRVLDVKPMQISQNVFAIPKGFGELIAG